MAAQSARYIFILTYLQFTIFSSSGLTLPLQTTSKCESFTKKPKKAIQENLCTEKIEFENGILPTDFAYLPFLLPDFTSTVTPVMSGPENNPFPNSPDSLLDVIALAVSDVFSGSSLNPLVTSDILLNTKNTMPISDPSFIGSNCDNYPEPPTLSTINCFSNISTGFQMPVEVSNTGTCLAPNVVSQTSVHFDENRNDLSDTSLNIGFSDCQAPITNHLNLLDLASPDASFSNPSTSFTPNLFPPTAPGTTSIIEPQNTVSFLDPIPSLPFDTTSFQPSEFIPSLLPNQDPLPISTPNNFPLSFNITMPLSGSIPINLHEPLNLIAPLQPDAEKSMDTNLSSHQVTMPLDSNCETLLSSPLNPNLVKNLNFPNAKRETLNTMPSISKSGPPNGLREFLNKIMPQTLHLNNILPVTPPSNIPPKSYSNVERTFNPMLSSGVYPSPPTLGLNQNLDPLTLSVSDAMLKPFAPLCVSQPSLFSITSANPINSEINSMEESLQVSKLPEFIVIGPDTQDLKEPSTSQSNMYIDSSYPNPSFITSTDVTPLSVVYPSVPLDVPLPTNNINPLPKYFDAARAVTAKLNNFIASIGSRVFSGTTQSLYFPSITSPKTLLQPNLTPFREPVTPEIPPLSPLTCYNYNNYNTLTVNADTSLPNSITAPKIPQNINYYNFPICTNPDQFNSFQGSLSSLSYNNYYLPYYNCFHTNAVPANPYTNLYGAYNNISPFPKSPMPENPYIPALTSAPKKPLSVNNSPAIRTSTDSGVTNINIPDVLLSVLPKRSLNSDVSSTPLPYLSSISINSTPLSDLIEASPVSSLPSSSSSTSPISSPASSDGSLVNSSCEDIESMLALLELTMILNSAGNYCDVDSLTGVLSSL